MKENEEILEKFYQSSLHFLSFRPRSQQEITNFITGKLKRAKISEPEKIIESIIEKLKKENLVNDEEFADWWLQQRQDFNPKGKIILTYELKQKGIDKSIIEEKLNQIKQDDQQVLIKKIIAKKINLYPNLDRQHLKKKILEHLARRGFTFDLSLDLVDDFLEKSYNKG